MGKQGDHLAPPVADPVSVTEESSPGAGELARPAARVAHEELLCAEAHTREEGVEMVGECGQVDGILLKVDRSMAEREEGGKVTWHPEWRSGWSPSPRPSHPVRTWTKGIIMFCFNIIIISLEHHHSLTLFLIME